MYDRFTNKVLVLLLIYLLIIFGYIFSRGFYFLPGLFLILLAAILLVLFHRNQNVGIGEESRLIASMNWMLILFVVLSMGMYGGLYQNDLHGFVSLSRTLLMIAIVISFLYVFDFSKWLFSLNKLKFWLLLVIAVALRILMIWSSPAPYIDVFYIQKIAPIALISGVNPYSILYPKLYPTEMPDVYSYGPAVIFLDMPAVFLTGDPRYTMVVAEIGTALLVYLMLRKGAGLFLKKGFRVAELLPLIFLYNPASLFIIEQAWVDPLLIFILTLFIFLLFHLRKKFLAWVILGIAIATKQYTVFLLPFLLRGKLIKISHLIISGITAVAIMAPFFIWNVKDFIHDVVLYQLTIQHPRYDSLSLNSLLHRITGFDIPTILVVIVVILVLVYLLKTQKKLTVSAAFLATSTLALCIFLVYKLAFIHYYYFAGSLLFLSVVLLLCESAKSFIAPKKSSV